MMTARSDSDSTVDIDCGDTTAHAGGFRLFGAQLRIDVSLIVILVLITYSLGAVAFVRWHPEWGPDIRWTVAASVSMAFFASVLLHALSHAPVARAQGIVIRKITLFAFGGIARAENPPSSPKTEFLMAGVGPLTSIVIGVVATAGGWWLAGVSSAAVAADPEAVLRGMGPVATIVACLGPINLVLGVSCLVPGLPLAGARVLRSLLWWVSGDVSRATRWVSAIGLGFAGLLIGLGVLNVLRGDLLGSLWLLSIGGVVLWRAARGSDADNPQSEWRPRPIPISSPVSPAVRVPVLSPDARSDGDLHEHAKREVGASEEAAALQTRSLGPRPRPADPEPGGPETPQLGDVIDDHLRIEGVLGSGGMGTVYLARDVGLDRLVAVKLLHADRVRDPKFRRRFVAEARAMARVEHENVVAIHSWAESDGFPYIVMECIRGHNLAQWHRRCGELSVATVVSVMDATCRGVQAIHNAGTVHRDLKPGNVMVGPRERIAVSDFGLAVSCDAVPYRLDDVTGTPAYLAPELARGDVLSPDLVQRIDVYALGVIAFELLTRGRPFSASSFHGLLQQSGFDEPPPPSALRPELPAVVDRVVLRALSRLPEARTETADAFREELAAALRCIEDRPWPRRVLLVDDDLVTLSAMRELLLLEWPLAEIITAADARTAGNLAQTHGPDVVVTDYHMPNGGAPGLTHRLRASPITCNVPIVVVTGVASALDWQHLRGLGADRFLVKPVDADDLVTMVRAAITARNTTPRDGAKVELLEDP